jgi:hypothetical protein
MTLTRESHSLFQDLLEDPELVEAFVQGREEEVTATKGRRQRTSRGNETSQENSRDPENAFLAIGVGVRTAMKKHLPVGMLESVENALSDYFQASPSGRFSEEGWSSYERLLAHACCAYNGLTSRSKHLQIRIP